MSAVNQLPVEIMQCVKTWLVGIIAPARKVIRHPQGNHSSRLMMAHTAKVSYMITFYVILKSYIKYNAAQ